MLLCLSSGYRQRYLEDILRAVAMPAGLDLRFRYTVDHISRDLHDPLKNNGHQGEVVLIGYLDRSDSDHAQEIVPCRFATLQESKILGDICVLTLRLTDYAFAESESDAMAELQLRAKDLPHWDGLKPAGKLCQYLGNGTLRNIKKTSDIGDWQKLVDQLNIHT